MICDQAIKCLLGNLSENSVGSQQKASWHDHHKWPVFQAVMSRFSLPYRQNNTQATVQPVPRNLESAWNTEGIIKQKAKGKVMNVHLSHEENCIMGKCFSVFPVHLYPFALLLLPGILLIN